MGNHVTVRQKINNLPDRTIALLGLQQSSETQTTACPTDAELADFIKGKLTDQAREKMLIHLDQCSDCYQYWINELRAPQSKPQQKSEQKTKSAWWDGLGEVLHLHKSWQISTYLATLIMFVILIRAINPTEPDIVEDNNVVTTDSQPVTSASNNDTSEVALSPSIAKDYNEVIAKDIQVDKVHEVSPKLAMSMTAAPLFTDGSIVYKTCLANGFDALNKTALLTTTADAKYKTVCELAQWVALISSILSNHIVIKSEFWQRQLEQSQHFEQYFRDIPKTQIGNDLQRIGQEISLIVADSTKLDSPSFIDNLQNDLINLSQCRF